MRNKKVVFSIIYIAIFPLVASLQSLAQVPPNKSIYIAQQAQAVSPDIAQNSSTTNNTVISKDENLVATVISILSLIVAISVAYTSNFRRANIEVSLGRNIVLFSTGQVQPGLSFNLPITFYNWSPQGGTIKKIRMVIGKKNSDDFYDMAWTTFVEIGSSGNFEDKSLALPIPVKGQASVNKIIRFDWITELSGKQFDLQASDYKLKIYLWVKDTEKADLKYEASFNLSDDHYKKYKNSLVNNLTQSIWLSLDENEKPNQLVSGNMIDRLYSNGK